MSKYKIVFISSEIPLHHRERVKSNLSVIFRQPVKRLDALFQDRPVTLKKGLNLDEANRYRDAVVREGGACRIEPMPEAGASTLASARSRSTADIISCPRCGTRQHRTPICSGCGIILQSFDDEIRAAKAQQKWKPGDVDRRNANIDRRVAADRRGDLRFQYDRREGSERRAGIANWHRNHEVARAEPAPGTPRNSR
jgi:ribosomal protein L37E